MEAELAPGEKIIWVGCPDPIAFAAEDPIRPVDILAVIGSLAVWLVFLIAVMSLPHWRAMATGLTVLSSLLSSVAVSYFLCRRSFGACAQAQRIVYALTDRRGLIIQQHSVDLDRRVRSLSAEDLYRMSWREAGQ